MFAEWIWLVPVRRRGKPRWQAASMTFWGKGQELPLSCPGAAGEGLKDKKAHKHQKCWSSQWPGESQQSTPQNSRYGSERSEKLDEV